MNITYTTKQISKFKTNITSVEITLDENQEKIKLDTDLVKEFYTTTYEDEDNAIPFTIKHISQSFINKYKKYKNDDDQYEIKELFGDLTGLHTHHANSHEGEFIDPVFDEIKFENNTLTFKFYWDHTSDT